GTWPPSIVGVTPTRRNAGGVANVGSGSTDPGILETRLVVELRDVGGTPNDGSETRRLRHLDRPGSVRPQCDTRIPHALLLGRRDLAGARRTINRQLALLRHLPRGETGGLRAGDHRQDHLRLPGRRIRTGGIPGHGTIQVAHGSDSGPSGATRLQALVARDPRRSWSLSEIRLRSPRASREPDGDRASRDACGGRKGADRRTMKQADKKRRTGGR